MLLGLSEFLEFLLLSGCYGCIYIKVVRGFGVNFLLSWVSDGDDRSTGAVASDVVVLMSFYFYVFSLSSSFPFLVFVLLPIYAQVPAERKKS